jgi:hypothetical protein
VFKGTLRSIGLGGPVAFTVMAFALVGPAVAAADVGPVKGVAAPVAAAVNPVPAAKLPPVTEAVSNAAGSAASVASSLAATATKGVAVTAKAAKPLSHVTVTKTGTPLSVKTLVKSIKKGQSVYVFSTKGGKVKLKNVYGAARGLAGSTQGAHCEPQADGSTNCVLPLEGDATNTCTGDFVQILPDSWFHEKTSFTVGVGSVTVTDFINWQNVKGLAQDGTPYSMMDITRSTQNSYAIPVAGQIAVAREEMQNLISQGPKPNQLLRVSLTVVFGVDPITGDIVFVVQPPQGPGIKCTG